MKIKVDLNDFNKSFRAKYFFETQLKKPIGKVYSTEYIAKKYNIDRSILNIISRKYPQNRIVYKGIIFIGNPKDLKEFFEKIIK